jgi:hypothetical protein
MPASSAPGQRVCARTKRHRRRAQCCDRPHILNEHCCTHTLRLRFRHVQAQRAAAPCVPSGALPCGAGGSQIDAVLFAHAPPPVAGGAQLLASCGACAARHAAGAQRERRLRVDRRPLFALTHVGDAPLRRDCLARRDGQLRAHLTPVRVSRARCMSCARGFVRGGCLTRLRRAATRTAWR